MKSKTSKTPRTILPFGSFIFSFCIN
jgi:hypothetical protein